MCVNNDIVFRYGFFAKQGWFKAGNSMLVPRNDSSNENDDISVL